MTSNKFRTCLYINFVLCVVLLENRVYTQLALDTSCQTPTKDPGSCISIKKCKPIVDLIRSLPSPLSQEAKKNLADYACGYEGDYPKVCCPSSSIILQTRNNFESLEDNVTCTTPDGKLGNCMPMKQCKSITDLIINLPKPITQMDTDKIREYSCSSETKSVHVCCPTTPISFASRTNADQVDNKTSSTSSIMNHRNLRLLPKECGYVNIGDKIAYGVDADLFEFPWMALLSYSTAGGPQFKCGGTIINDKWILTAGHCIAGLKDLLLEVRVGEHDILSRMDCKRVNDVIQWCAPPVQNLGIEELWLHPNFNKTSFMNDDIGLIRVTRINFGEDNPKPVCLPLTEDLMNSKLQNLEVSGWGTTETGYTSNILQKVTLPVTSLENCRNEYLPITKVTITKKQICAKGDGKKDSCGGDSGGPLQQATYLNGEIRYVQHGIVSFGTKICGLPHYPGVYTKVASYIDWILDTIH